MKATKLFSVLMTLVLTILVSQGDLMAQFNPKFNAQGDQIGYFTTEHIFFEHVGNTASINVATNKYGILMTNSFDGSNLSNDLTYFITCRNPQGHDVFRIEPTGTVRIGSVPGTDYENDPIGAYNMHTYGDEYKNYKLFVEKGILTEKVKVELKDNWADYVFDQDYELNTLKEVEDFISENKHLPNVPSAETVAETGIDVATMDATLLRQIEELWLHTIQLNKEKEELETENEELQDKYEALIERIEALENK